MIENRGDTGLLPGFIFGPFCCLRFAGFHVLDAFRHWERYRQVRRGDRLARVRRRVFLALLRPLRKGVSEKASLADLGRGSVLFFSVAPVPSGAVGAGLQGGSHSLSYCSATEHINVASSPAPI